MMSATIEMITTTARATQPKAHPPTSHRKTDAPESSSPVITVLAMTTSTYFGETRRHSPTVRSIRSGMDALRTLVVVARGQRAEQLGHEPGDQQDHRSSRRDRGEEDGVPGREHVARKQVRANAYADAGEQCPAQRARLGQHHDARRLERIDAADAAPADRATDRHGERDDDDRDGDQRDRERERRDEDREAHPGERQFGEEADDQARDP